MASRINPNRAWHQACQIVTLLLEHLPERAPPLLLSLLRPPPAKPNTTTDPYFTQPKYLPVLEVTAEDLGPFCPRDWNAFLARSTTAISPPSPSTTTGPSPSTEESGIPVEVGLVFMLIGVSILCAAVAIKYRKKRVLGLGRSGGGCGARRRFRRDPTGLLYLLPGSAGARPTRNSEADGAAWLAQLAAAETRGRDHVDQVREAISFRLPSQETRRPGSRRAERICNISYLLSYPPKPVGTDPVEHLATVPEWKNEPSEGEADDYKAATLAKLGSIVCPLNMDFSATDEQVKMRQEWVDKCNCSNPGSEDCVRVHVEKARSWIKDQLGGEAFRNCGLDAMGEQVGELWNAADRKKLVDVDKLIPQNKHQMFMKIALRELSQKKQKDLAKYYYNVFLPRRLASLTRAGHKKDGVVDTGDENDGHLPQNKSKSSGSSLVL